MFRTHTSVPQTVSPVAPDWTIRELMAWIAADDTRCHDETLRPVLTAVAESARPGSLLRPTSTVALVRAVAARLRAEPATGERRVGDVAPGRTAAHASRAPRHTVVARAAASSPEPGTPAQWQSPR
ncbi:MAG: hypothetical protein ACTHNQ_05640 [Microbacterium sp.]